MSLKQKTFSSVKWQVFVQVGQKVVSVATFAVLARILDPEVFGLFALSFVLINGLSMFKALGVDAGVIQRKNVSEATFGTAFIIIQLMGLFVCSVCFIAGPFVGKFFGHPEVGSVVQALGIVFVLDGFGKVPSTLLQKAMRFQSLSIIQFIGAVVNSVCAVIFALMNPTVWALVWAYLMKTIVMNILLWRVSSYRLKLIFDRGEAKDLLGFGSHLMGGNIFGFISENLNNAVVGKLLDATRVGYIALAGNAAAFINTHFTVLIQKVMLPAYSTVHEDRNEVKRIFFKVLKYISLVVFPFSVALMMLSEEMVLILYGSKWLMIVPLVQITACSEMIASLMSGAGPVYVACGRPKYMMHIAALNLFIRVPLVILMTSRWGVIGTVTSVVLARILILPFSFLMLKHTIHFSLREFLLALRPAALCAAIMAVGIGAAKWILLGCDASILTIPPALMKLIFATSIGSLLYFAALYFIDRTAAVEIKGLVRGVRPS